MSLPKPYWEEPGITVYHGDCRDILPMLPDKSVDLVLTDPPYGIEIVRKSNNFGDCADLSRKASGESWDDHFPGADVWGHVFRVSRNQVVFGANYGWQHFHSSGCYIVWDKRGSLPMVPFAPTEFAWTSFDKQSKKYTVINHGFVTDVAEARQQHPCQKPERLMRQIVSDFSTEGETILDPFMGSGTTLVAAKQLGRKAIGIEIEEKYCEIAVKRLAQAVLDFEDRPKRELWQLAMALETAPPEDRDGIKAGIEDWIVEDAMEEAERAKR